ncbi:MAG: hypothetical protein ABI925_02885, partial [Verrucomicrobiota bacterium]
MARHTAFTQRFMLEDERTSLRCMALETGFVLAQESSAAAFEGLRKVSPAAFDRRSLVRVVAVGATNFSFENRMVMRQGKLRAHLGVALKTRCRRFA